MLAAEIGEESGPVWRFGQSGQPDLAALPISQILRGGLGVWNPQLPARRRRPRTQQKPRAARAHSEGWPVRKRYQTV